MLRRAACVVVVWLGGLAAGWAEEKPRRRDRGDAKAQRFWVECWHTRSARLERSRPVLGTERVRALHPNTLRPCVFAVSSLLPAPLKRPWPAYARCEGHAA